MYPLVVPGCDNIRLVGNGICNDETNNAGCKFDQGDCCLSNVDKTHCSECICYGQETCDAGIIPSSVGDGFCNDETNNAYCNYDGGDCCVNVNTDRCSSCTCFYQENCFAGFIPSIVGDGLCNDDTNNAICNYDSGDCCISSVTTDHCSECRCYGQELCTAGIIPSSVGDGICNDETNNEHCNYDGLDCCQIPVNITLCSVCSCHGQLIFLLKLWKSLNKKDWLLFHALHTADPTVYLLGLTFCIPKTYLT